MVGSKIARAGILAAIQLMILPLRAAPPSATPAREPAYPVMGILQTDPALTSVSISSIADAEFEALRPYRLIYTSDGPALQAVRDAKKRLGLPGPVIVYMGGFTTNRGGATEIEQKYRQAVALIDVARLAAPLDAAADTVRLEIPPDGEFALKASTADVSDPDDFSKFCFWIRIGDELMKVVAVDEAAREARVVRGFESTAAAHEAGAVVLTPVYVGNRNDLDAVRHSNSWPGGPDYLRYALDPATPAAQRYKADLIVNLMKSGYDGAWLDTFQPRPYNLCDANGRPVRYYWDQRQGRRYEPASFVGAIQEMLRGMRVLIRAEAGREPVLAANSCSGSYDQGSKDLFINPERPGLLDGYCFEDSYLRPRAERAEGRKLKAAFEPIALKGWQRNIANQGDAARSGLTAYCMMGPAGYVAAYINPALENYERLVRFSWCSHLLTVTRERTLNFGWPAMITRLEGGRVGFLPMPELFFAPVGDPVEDSDPEKMKIANSPCYWRRFENGLTVVNPAEQGEAARVAIPAGYVDHATGQPVETLTLSPGDAALLLKAKN